MRVRTDGDLTGIPRGVDLSAYRIVQESLTNVLKHARARHVEVLLRSRGRCVEIDVTDDGTAAPAPGTGGLGLIGMREAGGRLWAAQCRPGPWTRAGTRSARRCRSRLGEQVLGRDHPACSSSTTRPSSAAGSADAPRPSPTSTVVGEAADGAEAVAGAPAAPDVVLMDIRMPASTGIEATRASPGPGRRRCSSSPPSTSTSTSSRPAGRRQRVPAQGRAAGGAGRGRSARCRRRRRAARPDDHPAADRDSRRRPRGSPPAWPTLTDRELEVLALSPAGCPTPRSPRTCSSARRRSRPTSGGSSPSWPAATGCRRWSSPTRPGSSIPASVQDEPGRAGRCVPEPVGGGNAGGLVWISASAEADIVFWEC